MGDRDVELIQPVAGENDYTAQLAERGEGLHRVVTFSSDDVGAAVEAYRDSGVLLLQSGVYAYSHIWYLDAREAAKGLVLEIVEVGDADILEPDHVYAM